MSDNKVVNSFQQRRELAQAFEALSNVSNEAAMIDAAYVIVETFPADLVLTTLIKRLDTADSQLRGGLGHVAALLPVEQAAPALLAAVADRRGTPERRVAAALILERYLDQAPPPAMMGDLENANEVAFQSLTEAIELGKQDRHILLEYVTQMRQTEPAVAYMVMDMLVRVEPDDCVDILRLIAQDDRPDVAEDALLRLEVLARDEGVPGATRALHTLQFVLPVDLADQVRRTLRKLRFSGNAYEPPQPDEWRSLITPADPAGFQTIWLVRYPQDTGRPGAVLGFVLNRQMGIRQMFGSEELPAAHLPDPQPEGEMVEADVGGGRSLTMLTTPFDFGRWLVLQASASQRQHPADHGFADEYQLYNDLIWAYAEPTVDPAVAAFFDSNPSSDLTVDMAGLSEISTALLRHPSMVSWTRQNIMLVQGTESLQGEIDKLPADLIVRHIQREFAAMDEREVLMLALENGLRAQAAWLHYAGDQRAADQAWLLASQMQAKPIDENPFLTQVITLGLAQFRHGG